MKMIQGKNINLRTVEIEDASFILELRMVKHKNKFLSSVENDLEKQKIWLKRYKIKEHRQQEYYFVIESKTQQKLGLVRAYDLKLDSFCWGSWLIKDKAPQTTAIESALLVYEFGFNQLGYKQSHFDVRKGNSRVIDFHLRFGAKIIDEDELNYYFDYDAEIYKKIKQKYRRYLN